MDDNVCSGSQWDAVRVRQLKMAEAFFGVPSRSAKCTTAAGATPFEILTTVTTRARQLCGPRREYGPTCTPQRPPAPHACAQHPWRAYRVWEIPYHRRSLYSSKHAAPAISPRLPRRPIQLPSTLARQSRRCAHWQAHLCDGVPRLATPTTRYLLAKYYLLLAPRYRAFGLHSNLATWHLAT